MLRNSRLLAYAFPNVRGREARLAEAPFNGAAAAAAQTRRLAERRGALFFGVKGGSL